MTNTLVVCRQSLSVFVCTLTHFTYAFVYYIHNSKVQIRTQTIFGIVYYYNTKLLLLLRSLWRRTTRVAADITQHTRRPDDTHCELSTMRCECCFWSGGQSETESYTRCAPVFELSLCRLVLCEPLALVGGSGHAGTPPPPPRSRALGWFVVLCARANITKRRQVQHVAGTYVLY